MRPPEFPAMGRTARRQIPRTAKADTTVRGTRSDLLLWLANRGTPDVLDVSGRSGLLERWVQLWR